MDAKQFVMKIEDIDAKIEGRSYEIAKLKLIASGRTSQWGSERVQSSGSHDKMANTIVQYIDYENDAEICELMQLKQEIIDAIKKLQTKHYKMLHRIYVQGMSIRDVYLQEGMSRTWGDNTHNNALKELQGVIDNMEEGEWDVLKDRLLRI